jgi:hypothetical protein
MKMRRVAVAILVPADEFVNNDAVITAVKDGFQEYMCGGAQNVSMLSDDEDDIVDFTDEKWKLLKADRGQVQLEQKVYGTQTGRMGGSKPRP